MPRVMLERKRRTVPSWFDRMLNDDHAIDCQRLFMHDWQQAEDRCFAAWFASQDPASIDAHVLERFHEETRTSRQLSTFTVNRRMQA